MLPSSPFPSLNTFSALLCVSASSSLPPICPTNPRSKILISSSSREMHKSVCSCFIRCAFTSFTNRTVAAPARYPAVISSTESLHQLRMSVNAQGRNLRLRLSHRFNENCTTYPTIIKSLASSNPQVFAICKIPAGSGFGGLKSLVTTGANDRPVRNLFRR